MYGVRIACSKHIFYMATKMSIEKSPMDELQLADTAPEGKFPVPLTIDEFRHHVLNLFYLKMRTISTMAGDKAAWRITGKAPFEDDAYTLFDPERTPEDVGLIYDDICNTEFATCMESMYHYGYFGVIDDVVNGSVNCMEYGSNFTWIAAIAHDMVKSLEITYLDETWGTAERESAAKCYHFVEVANARCILENGRNFLHYDNSKEEDPPSYDRNTLSVPQMALLAGMGEMSIRAAANPKRVNPLKTYSDEGRTRISLADAKAWLMAKGRYVPVTRRSGDIVINLVKRKFFNLTDLFSVINTRISFIGGDDIHLAQLKARYPEFLVNFGVTGFDKYALSNIDLVRDLAAILGFPADLFSLRVREVLAKEALAAVEREVRILTSSKN